MRKSKGATHERDSNVGQNRTCLFVKEGNDRRESVGVGGGGERDE
jgi:hypothetical protein